MGDSSCYWVGFSLVVGIGPKRFQQLLDFFGDAETAWQSTRSDLKQAGLDNRTISSFLEARSQINPKDEYERIIDRGYRVLTWNCELYPDRLKNIYSPPFILYVWGEIKSSDQWAVAVIGTRRASPYGKSVAAEFATGLVLNGITVISGLARGIDSEAHQSALSAGGRTIGVLGSGLDRIYPPENRRLARSIAENGAIISEYPLGTSPEPGNFPARNRIISGLAMGVLVVEAGERSGALITVNFAAEQGREVFAIPGDINKKNSRGTNRLIQTGAFPVTRVEDVLEILNFGSVPRQIRMELADLEDTVERDILKALTNEPMHVDDIQAQSDYSAAEVSAGMSMLELRGLIRQVGGSRYVRLNY